MSVLSPHATGISAAFSTVDSTANFTHSLTWFGGPYSFQISPQAAPSQSLCWLVPPNSPDLYVIVALKL